MEKTRLPPRSLDTHASLENLNSCLHSLLSLAEQGEWDSIGNITDQLLDALSAADTTKFSDQGDQAAILHTLSLLKLAIQQCVTRKEQITPLINALTRNKLQVKP